VLEVTGANLKACWRFGETGRSPGRKLELSGSWTECLMTVASLAMFSGAENVGKLLAIEEYTNAIAAIHPIVLSKAVFISNLATYLGRFEI
jgi:hypothetical protein